MRLNDLDAFLHDLANAVGRSRDDVLLMSVCAADCHGHICKLLLLRLHPGEDSLPFEPLLQAHAAGKALSAAV